MARRVIEPVFALNDHVEQIQKLMRKYRDVPMSLADACLVRMSEVYSNGTVFTLDSDFRVYRRNGRQAIPLLSPGSVRS